MQQAWSVKNWSGLSSLQILMRAEILKHLIVFMISDLYSGIGHSWVGRKT